MAELQWVLQYLLAVVFLAPALGKLRSWTRFRDSVAAMDVVSPSNSTVVAALLPPIEGCLGVALLVDFKPELAFWAVFTLLGGFTALLVRFWWMGGTEFRCGCFGSFEEATPIRRLIARNLLLMVASVPLWRVMPVPSGALDWSVWGSGALSVAGLMLIWMMATRVLDTVTLLRGEIAAEEPY